MKKSISSRRWPGLLSIATLLALGACAQGPDEAPITISELVAGPTPSISIEQAEQALAAGRAEEARNAFTRHVALTEATDPDGIRARFGLAEALRATGQGLSAMELYSAVENDTAMRARAKLGKGLAQMARGDCVGASQSFRHAAAADSTEWRAWNGLGACADDRRDWGEAEEAYRRARELKPDSPIILNNHGVSLMLQGRYAEAAAQFGKAVKVDRNQLTIRNNLRLALAWQGRYRDATAGADHRSEGQLYNDVGYVALQRGDFDRARRYLTKAMEQTPRFNRQAWANLRMVDEATGAENPRASREGR